MGNILNAALNAVSNAIDYTEEQIKAMISQWTAQYRQVLSSVKNYLAEDERNKADLIEEARRIETRIHLLEGKIRDAAQNSNIGVEPCAEALEEVVKHLKKLENWID